MKLKYSVVAAFLAISVWGSSDAEADIIDIISEAGTTCILELGSGLVGDPCVTEEIGPHSLWQGNDPNPPGYGGVWVSYDDTGVDGTTLAPRDREGPIFTIVESFTIDSAGSIDFWIWADDTADVYFNLDSAAAPELVFRANFFQDICADGSIGCEPDEYFNLARDLAAGTYDITISVYQLGFGTTPANNPFGVLYSGRVTTVVPEPGTLALFGAGLLGLGLARRRKVKV